MRDADVLGYFGIRGSVTNVTINGGTLTATAAGNQGYMRRSTLPVETMGSIIQSLGPPRTAPSTASPARLFLTISGAVALLESRACRLQSHREPCRAELI